MNEININNYYVCEAHFENQVLDYATRKILIRNAQPNALADSVNYGSTKSINGRQSVGSFKQDVDDIDGKCILQQSLDERFFNVDQQNFFLRPRWRIQ